ncbi:HAMP domain-containing sensor histidine kinase [Vibrio mangrovi]|uniref:histidine kinase n=1 Tax=Vibrio mangrovi TaxID=474394 RepID=A0A1Y6IZ71_9VIBR|nr:HAMP domain-containing sensor histidine kinase [Vibrio mangrovi]MDW6005121.1 HAMP domain-containing sensor histidine kinase [Vibrio mangrovi]SMS02957.1 Sensor histidine kinase YycG [Vibrio mangrovi]
MIQWYQRQKLIHQIGWIIFIGFCVSGLLSLYLLSSEKSKNLSYLSTSGAIQRVISVVDILSQTPPELHSSILRASSSSDLSLAIATSPRIESTAQNQELNRLRRQMASAGIQEVNLSLIQQPRSILIMSGNNMDNMHNAMMSGRMQRNQPNHHRGYLATIDGSVRLQNGSWLNFSSGVQKEIIHWSSSVLLSLTLVMLGTILISLLIVRRALKPIRDLGTAAETFAQKKQVTPVNTDGPQDLYPTIKAFNEMQSELANYLEERTKLLAAISHDLRTPLTSLRLRLEFIEDSEDKHQMLRTLSVMEKMLQSTLSFAKNDTYREARQPTDIHSLMQTIVDEYMEKNTNIIYQAPANMIENVPPLGLRRMTENLINNSVQYGGESVTITLSVKTDQQYLTVSVIDTGIGIDATRLTDVLKPFTRLNSARDTDSSNVGLGLSITQSLAKAYGGDLTLTSNKPHGLIATFTIALH